MFWNLGIFLMLWLILAQSCMTFRKTDNTAKKEFAKDSVMLTTATILVDGHHIHYALTGNDTLPTLFFIHGSPGSWDAFPESLKVNDLLRHFPTLAIARPR